jgi:hypothetical protein
MKPPHELLRDWNGKAIAILKDAFAKLKKN